MPKTKPGFLPSVLRVTGAAAAKTRKLLSGKRGAEKIRQDILALLAAELAPGAWPSWLVLEPEGTLEDLLHLAPPMFFAKSADGDEFYGEVESPHLIYRGKGRAHALAPGRDEPLATKLVDADLPRIDGYQTAGEVVLTDLRWIEPAPSSLKALDPLLKAADRAFHGELAAYEAKDLVPGPQGKKKAAAAPSAPPASGAGGAFLGGFDRSNFDPADGPKKAPKSRWSVDSNADGDEWGGYPVVADGHIFVGSASFNAFFTCVNAESGKVVWTRKMATTQCWPANSACVDRGILYLATNHGLYALEALTGKDRWMAKGSGITSSAIVAGELCYVGCKKSLDAHALDTGRRKWSFKVKDRVHASPAYRDGVLYFRADQQLYALDALEGKKVLFTAKASGYGPTGPVLSEDLVIFEDHERGLTALSIDGGKPRWRTKLEGLATPLAVGGGVVVAIDNDGRVLGIDAKSGKKRWTYDSKEEDVFPKGGPVIAGSVAVAVVKSNLTGLDLESGKLLWKLKFPGTIAWRSQSTPAAKDGVLYVQEYGALHALK
ncbi:MAG: PQQ-binding-like beta-propeller repeat protein [Myxococcota bacterium]